MNINCDVEIFLILYNVLSLVLLFVQHICYISLFISFNHIITTGFWERKVTSILHIMSLYITLLNQKWKKNKIKCIWGIIEYTQFNHLIIYINIKLVKSVQALT